jgi:anti-sigma regulatory factor (Ser/Thr protein kinase)
METQETDRTPTVTLAPDVREWGRLQAFLDGACARFGVPESVRFDLQLICEEWFLNVVTHGFRDLARAAGGTGHRPFFRLTVRKNEDGEIALIFEDNAVPFDPLAHPEPDLAAETDRRPVGGLGIYLIRRKADRCAYRRIDGLNELTAYKKIR